MTAKRTLIGRLVIDNDGEKIGTVHTVYSGDRSFSGTDWVSVKTGWFGQKEALMPASLLREAADGALTAPIDVRAAHAAPHGNPGEQLTAEQIDELVDFYGLRATTTEPDPGSPAGEIGNSRAGERLHDKIVTRVLRGPQDLPGTGEDAPLP